MAGKRRRQEQARAHSESRSIADDALVVDVADEAERRGIAVTWGTPLEETVELKELPAAAFIPSDPRLHGYTYEIFGRRAAANEPAYPPGLILVDSQTQQPAIHLVGYRVRVYPDGTTLCLERTCYPNDIWMLSIRGLKPNTKAKDIKAAWHGRYVLEIVAPADIGRPEDSDEEALAEMVGWANQWLKQHPTAQPREISRPALLEFAGMTPGSLKNRMYDKHITLKKIRAELDP
jgi:hypothetical protein